MDLLVYKWMELSLVIESKWSDWYKLIYLNRIWISGPTYLEKEEERGKPQEQHVYQSSLNWY